VKQQVKQLVREGRLEFVNGGWVAPDEACPSYEDLLLNKIIGHTFLNGTFGYIPKHAWNVDSFGHSSAMPELLRRMGFESLFFARVSSEERNFGKSKKELEFIWQPTYESATKGTLNNSYGIFTHILNENYQAPCNLDVF
jgi:alpha-mannosidase